MFCSSFCLHFFRVFNHRFIVFLSSFVFLPVCSISKLEDQSVSHFTERRVFFLAAKVNHSSQLIFLKEQAEQNLDFHVTPKCCFYFQDHCSCELPVLSYDVNCCIVRWTVALWDELLHADGLQVPVSSWFDDMDDKELLDLVPFFENLASVDNVYSLLRCTTSSDSPGTTPPS